MDTGTKLPPRHGDSSDSNKSKTPSNWTSKQKKHCKITWVEVQNEGTKEEKKINHSYPPKEWCKLITSGLPLFKNKAGRTIVHADYAYSEYMSGTSFEDSIKKVKTYVNNVRESYIKGVKNFRRNTFIEICEKHYNEKDYEITVEELKTYQFTDLEIDEYTKHMADNGVMDIIETNGKKQYILKKLEDIKDLIDEEMPKADDLDTTDKKKSATKKKPVAKK